MGWLLPGDVWVDGGADAVPPASRRPTVAPSYTSWIYPQDENPAVILSWLATPEPGKRCPQAPRPRDVTASRVYPINEDIDQLLAWLGQGNLPLPPGRWPHSGQDVLPQPTADIAGIVPGWEMATPGGLRLPPSADTPAAANDLRSPALSYLPALAETPGLTEMWAFVPAGRPLRPYLARSSGGEPEGVSLPPVPDDLAATYAPWQSETVVGPRTLPRDQPPAGELPPPAFQADVTTWFAATHPAPQPGVRTPGRPVRRDNDLTPLAEELTAWQQVVFTTPSGPFPGRPAAIRTPAEPPPWRGVDEDPISHSGLWVQPGQPVPRPAPGRQGAEPLLWDVSQLEFLQVPFETSQPPRFAPAARPTWTQADSPMPSPVAVLVIILGGPYSVANSGLYWSTAIIGEVLPL